MEYKTILLPVAVTKKQTEKIETILNETAQEGWDLISMQAQTSMGGTDGNLAVFKRTT